MCTGDEAGGVESVRAGLAGLIDADVSMLADDVVREELALLLAAANQLHAAVLARAAVFDARGLAEQDGFRTARTWLQPSAGSPRGRRRR